MATPACNQVLVISDSGNAVVANITVENQPLSLAYDSGLGEIFVASYNSSSVSVISDSTNQIVATIEVGPSPNGVAYDPGTGRIFVSNYNSTSLSVIADANNTVITNVPLEKQPQGIAFDSGKGELFITYSESNKVSVIADLLPCHRGDWTALPEFTALVLILLVTAAGFLVVNLVHMKSKRRDKPPKFSWVPD